MTIAIAPLVEQHWPEVERIYAAGIATGHATFEAAPPSWEAFDASGRVVGWVAASPVSQRCVYAGVVEHSVYVAPEAQGRGLGRTLLEALVDSTEAAGIWTIQSGIFPENHASLALHRDAGFEVVGVRRRIGRMDYGPLAGTWRDVVFIERRSDHAGTG